MIYISLFGLVIKSDTVYTKGWYAFTTTEDTISSIVSKHQSIGWTVPLNQITDSIRYKLTNNIFDKDHTTKSEVTNSIVAAKAKSIFKSLLVEHKPKMFNIPTQTPKQDSNQLSLF